MPLTGDEERAIANLLRTYWEREAATTVAAGAGGVAQARAELLAFVYPVLGVTARGNRLFNEMAHDYISSMVVIQRLCEQQGVTVTLPEIVDITHQARLGLGM